MSAFGSGNITGIGEIGENQQKDRKYT